MKKAYLIFIVVLLFATESRSQLVTIPDPVMVQFFTNYYPTCISGNLLDTTCAAIRQETNIDFQGNPSNWDGLQYFRSLTDLTVYFSSIAPPLSNSITNLFFSNCFFTNIPSLPTGLLQLRLSECNGLTGLPVLPSTLISLEGSTLLMLTTLPALPVSLKSLTWTNMIMDPLSSPGGLTSLPVLPLNLETLDCSQNIFLTTLPVLPNKIRIFNCSDNSSIILPAVLPDSLRWLGMASCNLTAIPALPAHLETLAVINNSVSSLPVLPLSLTHLFAEQNFLTSLPVLPSRLQTLRVGLNQLTSLPALPATLQVLLCHVNQLTSLPALPASLQNLDCESNELTSIPALPNGLNRLNCRKNLLNILPDLPASLRYLSVDWNPNLFCLPLLPDSILELQIDERINCIPNQPTAYAISVYPNIAGPVSPDVYYPNGNPFPTCNPTNNSNHCNSYPLMKGYVYNDNNGNNIHDANEPFRSNKRVEIQSGRFVVTNSNGYYEIYADSVGNYTLTCHPPTYFTSVPPSYNYSFGANDTLVSNNFAFVAAASADSVTIKVTPLQARARPGFPLSFLVWYENSGTTTLAPTIAINYSTLQLQYDSSSDASVVHSPGTLQLSPGSMVSGASGSFMAYFHVNTTTALGDTIRFNADIRGSHSANNTDTAEIEVTGSFDPNDKSATPQLTSSDISNGKYIDYTIRFQNTGTDTAFNVVVTDTLSSFLQANSFEVLYSSHPCRTTVKNNIVYFEFLNILLPDSNVNEPLSHGLIRFRVKPVSTVITGNVVPNEAAIYFDYNLPVITNVATTEIVDPLVPIPLNLLSFAVRPLKDDRALITWTTANEISLKKFDIEVSLDGRTFSSGAAEIAKGGSSNNYFREIPVPVDGNLYFRLKMVDIDERFSYSNTLLLRRTSRSFSITANPVSDFLEFKVNTDLLNTFARVVNMQGGVVKSFKITDAVQRIDIRDLPAATYILQTIAGSMQFICK